MMGTFGREVSRSTDCEARHAMTSVLGRAAPAGHPPGRLLAEILGAGVSLSDVAEIALGRRAPAGRAEPPADVDHAEWRVDVLGLAVLAT